MTMLDRDRDGVLHVFALSGFDRVLTEWVE